MGIDVTSLAISVTSQGISETSQALDKLATSATNVGKALGSTQTPQKNLAASQKSSADAVEALLAKMQKQVDLLGSSKAFINEYNAATKGASDAQKQLAQNLGAQVDAFNAAQAAAKKHAAELKKAESGTHDFSLVTAGSTRELIVMSHELATGNLSRFGGSIIVMAERINFLPKAISAVTSAANAMGMSMGAVIGVFAALAGTIALVGINLYKAHEALVAFNNAVILTGHSAGATGQQLNGMATDIGASTGHINEAREAVLKLASTGRFTAEQIGLIATAAVNLNKYAGVSIEETVKQFEKLAAEPTRNAAKGFDGISKAAFDLDKQLHFLTPTILAHAIELEHQGKAAEASKIVIASLAEEENKRVTEMKSNLTILGRIADDAATNFKKMWNSLFTKGELHTQLAEAEAQLARMQKDHDYSSTGYGITKQIADIKKLKEQVAAQDKKDADDSAKNTADSLFKQDQMWHNSYVLRAKGNENFQEMLIRNAEFEQEAEKRGIVLSEEDKQRARLGIVKAAHTKEQAIRSEGLTDVNAQIAAIEALNEPKKRAMEYAIKLIDQEAKYKIISAEDAADKKDKILQNESALFEKYYKEELAIVEAFHGKTKSEENEAASLRSNIIKKLADLEEQNALKKAESLNKLTFSADEQERSEKKAADAFNKSIEKNISDIMAKVMAYQHLSNAQKLQGITEKQLQDQITLAKIDALKMDLLDDTLGQKEIDRINDKIAKMQELIGWQKQLEAAQQNNANALAGPAMQKSDAAALSAGYKTAGAEIEKALTSAFGKAGKAAGDMFKAYSDGVSRQIKLTETIAEAEKRKSAGDLNAQAVIDQARDESAASQLQSFGDIADAGANLFDKQSRGYKTLMTVSQVFHAAETALTLALNIKKAIGAVLNQGSGDPYSAFFRMAAMAAIVAGLGIAIGGAGGGGQSPEEKQAAAGTGSILGDAKAKSDSIAKSLKIMETNSGLGLVDSGEMVESLKTLNNSIAGLASVIVKGTNLTSPSADPVKTELLGKLGGPKALYDFAGLFSSTASNKDTGLQFGQQTLGSVQQSGMLTGSQYSVDEVTKKFIVTFSDKLTTSLTALGPEVSKQFGLVVSNLASSVTAAANILGLGGNGFAAHLQQFVIDIGQISTKGLTGDQFQKELETVFSKLGDDMAAFALAGLQQFQKVGEGYLETVTRVTNDLLQVRDVFSVLNQTMTATGLNAVTTSESLIAFAGDLATLTKNTKFFITNFETTAQQMAPITASVKSAMAALGESSVTTIQQFSDLVLAQDLNSAAGQKMYAELTAIAPQFLQAANYATDLANGTVKLTNEEQRLKDARDKTLSLETALIDALNGAGINLIATRQRELAALTATDRVIQQKIYDAQDRASAANADFTSLSKSVTDAKAVAQAAFTAQTNIINAAKDASTLAYNDFQTATQATLDTAKKANTALDGLANSLKSTLASMTLASQQASNRQAAQALIAQALATARSTGVLPTAESLAESLKTITQPSDNLFSNLTDYVRDFSLTKNDVSDLNDITKIQKSNSDLQLTALQDSLDLSKKEYDLAQKAFEQQSKDAQATLDAENTRLDAVLSYAQQQLDAMNGVQTTAVSIVTALTNFNSSVMATITAQQAAGVTARTGATQLPGQIAAPQGATTDQITAMYKNILGRAPDAAGLAFWQQKGAEGVSASSIAGAIYTSPEYTSVHGSHANGLDFVPFDNYRANLHAGERVQTAKAARDSDSTASEIRQMRSELSAALISIAVSTGSTARIQKRWDGDGMPPVRTGT